MSRLLTHDDLAEDDPCSPEEVYRLMFEDENLQPIDDYVVYYSEAEAMAAFATVMADPPDDAGSVYLTMGDDGVIVASHTFVDDDAF